MAAEETQSGDASCEETARESAEKSEAGNESSVLFQREKEELLEMSSSMETSLVHEEAKIAVEATK